MARAERAPFADRREAGRFLADHLSAHAGRDALVLGLPRGGVPVAAEVARRIGGLLDLLVVRKLGVPGQPELAMGAIAAVGDALETVRNEPVIDRAGIDEAAFEEVRACELTELRRRTAGYRQGREAPSPAGRHVIVVDDGLATGSTMRAAVAAARRPGPAWLVVAVPVASRRVCRELAAEVDEVVCPWTPATYSSVAQGYADFRQVTDDEVRAALAGAGSGTTG